jgi:hypothetical protein
MYKKNTYIFFINRIDNATKIYCKVLNDNDVQLSLEKLPISLNVNYDRNLIEHNQIFIPCNLFKINGFVLKENTLLEGEVVFSSFVNEDLELSILLFNSNGETIPFSDIIAPSNYIKIIKTIVNKDPLEYDNFLKKTDKIYLDDWHMFFEELSDCGLVLGTEERDEMVYKIVSNN